MLAQPSWIKRFPMSKVLSNIVQISVRNRQKGLTKSWIEVSQKVVENHRLQHHSLRASTRRSTPIKSKNHLNSFCNMKFSLITVTTTSTKAIANDFQKSAIFVSVMTLLFSSSSSSSRVSYELHSYSHSLTSCHFRSRKMQNRFDNVVLCYFVFLHRIFLHKTSLSDKISSQS